MIIGGLQKTTLIDFPGKIACIVFLAGCNFRCPWCDFAVKLDTNGSNPKMLKELIDVKLIDYVAMDIKTSLKSQITNHKSQKKSVYESLLVDGVKMADIEKSVEILKTHSQ